MAKGQRDGWPRAGRGYEGVLRGEATCKERDEGLTSPGSPLIQKTTGEPFSDSWSVPEYGRGKGDPHSRTNLPQ